MTYIFLFFFISGFCSILYEVIWLRLAMAEFGVTSAVVSIVLSSFMAGLGLGSLLSGYMISRYESKLLSPLRCYALTELLIGLSAILVPYQFLWGKNLITNLALSSSWSYYCIAGLIIALTI